MFTCDVVAMGGDTDQLLWDTYLDSFYVPLLTIMSTIWAAQSYELQNRSGSSWIPFDTVTVTWAGAAAGDYLPNAVALVLLGKAAGLRHVGRKFISGLPEVNSTGNALAAAALSYATSALVAYITPFTGIGGGTITPGVVDKIGTFHPFVGGVVSSLLGSMRRRKPGVGI
jgi:hypothetical protein